MPALRAPQEPLPERAASRMMVLNRSSESIEHRCVLDLPEYLNAGDLLVVNDTRVIPARIFGHRKDTGGKVELLLVERSASNEESWEALCRAGWKAREGIEVVLANGKLKGRITKASPEGRITVALSGTCNPQLRGKRSSSMLYVHGRARLMNPIGPIAI